MKLVVKTQRFRRSAACRSIATALVSVLVIGQLRAAYAVVPSGPSKAQLPDDALRGLSQRFRPSAIRRLSGASLESLWSVFDGDAATGLAGHDVASFEANFAGSHGLSAVGVFGAARGRLTVKAAGGRILAEKDFDEPSSRWIRLTLASNRENALTFTWTSTGEKGSLPELEVWGGDGSAGGASAARAPGASLPAAAVVFSSGEPARRLAGSSSEQDRRFTVRLEADPRSVGRAFLTYRVRAPRPPIQILRALNGGASLRGPVVVTGDETVVEEISPRALAAGLNRVKFDPPVASDPIGYQVGEVGLAILRSDDSGASASDPALGDDREGTLWDTRKVPTQTFSFEEATQLHELEFRLAKESRGSLVVSGGKDSRAVVDLADLGAGWHRVSLDGLPTTAKVEVTGRGTSDAPVLITEMHLNGSPLPSSVSPLLRLLEPRRGECVDHRVDLRVLAQPRPASLSVNGRAVRDLVDEGGAIAASVPEDQIAAPGKPAVVEVAAIYPGGAARKLNVHVEACLDRAQLADARPRPDAGAPFKTTVSAQKGGLVSYKDATLEIPPGALEADTEISIRPLQQGEYHALDAGMINVTARGQVFRLGPHNLKFKKPVRLTLPIDPARVAAEDDLETLYYDEAGGRWQEIPKSGSSGHELASLTTHFTDFIASTLAVPAHPGVQSLNPTSIKDMKLSDAAAGVEMMAPPAPNSRGTANLSYPIIVPPGRKGVQPKLAITYSSDAKNGPLGIGWNLSVPTIEVDTRFGVPRYQGSDRYVMGGQELSKLGSAPSGAPAGTYFVLRSESSFNWIQRVDISGGGYYWLVTDKAGTKYTYGQSAAARLQPNTSAGAADPTRAARWFLEKEEDMWGNQVLYSYSADTGTYGAISGTAGSGDRYYQIYPSSIAYTATSHSGPAPQYSVVFNYVSTRSDAFTEGRFGFLVYTQKLLGSVDVKNGAAVVRRYGLTYQPSGSTDFGKSLLGSIQVFGKGQNNLPTAAAIATHTLTYYTAPRDGANQYQLWSQPYEGNTYDPNVPVNELVAYTGPTDDIYEPNLTTSLANESHDSQGGGTNGIAGPLTVSVGKTESTSTGGPGFVDMNGDGLLDVLPSRPDFYTSVQDLLFEEHKGHFTPTSRPAWAVSTSIEHSRVMNGSFSFGGAGLNFGSSQSYGQGSEATSLLRDVNGDGFPDVVQTPQQAKLNPTLAPLISAFAANSLVVQLGDHGAFGPPVEWKGFDHQQLGFSCNQIFTQSGSSPGRTAYDFPTVDPITRWTAPYAGRVRIGGPVQLMEAGGDGVVVTLYRGNQKVWERDVQGSDTAACIPAAASPEPGSGCGASPTIVKTVAKGDRFYTRVNGKASTEHDVLSWAPTFEYIDAPASEANAREASGAYRYKFSQDTDSKAASADYIPWVAPFDGDVNLMLTIDKQPFSAVSARLIARHVSAGGVVQSILGEGSADAWLYPQVADGASNITSVFVKAGDLIYVGVVQSMPFDPELFSVSARIKYLNFGRTDPLTGQTVIGFPVCVPRDPSLGADSPTTCTIANDPDPLHPADGSLLDQYAPVQTTQKRWALKAPTAPAATPDGRKAVFSSSTTPTLQLCGHFTSDGDWSGTGVIGVIQGVNEVFGSTRGTSGYTCLTSYPVVSAGAQVIFAAYSFDNPSVQPSDFTASINGQSVPVEVYTIDSSFPADPSFFSLGQTDNMSGGMNGFSEGFWNGNFDFDEALIAAGENDHYQRATVVSYPTALANLSGAHVSSWFHSVTHVISKAAKAVATTVASGVKKVAVDVGSYAWKGVKYVGGVASKFTAWSICQTSDLVGKLGGPNFIGSYKTNGVSYSEVRSSTDHLTVGPVQASWSHSQTNAGLDLIDMNGDGLADDVTTGGVRYALKDPTTGVVSFAPFPSLVGLPKGRVNPTIRTVESNMYSTDASGSLSKSSGDNTPEVGSNSGGETTGMSASIGVSFSVGKGTSRTQRQLADMNGDGLPDIVESDPANGSSNLMVFINYGYGFGNAVNWTMPAWGLSPQGPGFDSLGMSPDSRLTGLLGGINSLQGGSVVSPESTLQLDEVVNSGDGAGFDVSVQSGYVNYDIGFTAGMDANYVMTFTRLTDVNGDGLVDQVYKAPGSDFFIKLNTGTGFQSSLLRVPAIAWPSDFLSPLNSIDAVSYRHGADTSLSGHGSVTVVGFGGGIEGHKASGGGTQSIDLTDLDGDGLPDHVAKATFSPATVYGTQLQFRAGEVLVRYNQLGKSNLLKSVANPLGGGFALDYSREGNYVGAASSLTAINIDMPQSRWCLSSVTTFDNFQNSYTDVIQYDPMRTSEGATRSFIGSGVYDRTEKEFYGFSRVRVVHGDGTQHMFYFRNDAYHTQGTLIAEYESDGSGWLPLRGSVDVTAFATIASTTPQAYYVQRVDHFDLKYDGSDSLTGSNAFGDYAPPTTTVPDGPFYHQQTRIYDTAGNLAQSGDLGDGQVSDDDVWFRMTYQTFSNTHFNPVTTVAAAATQGGAVLRQRDAIYATVNGRPTLSQITDLIIGGNQPTTGTAYAGSGKKTTYGFTFDSASGDFGNLKTYTDPSGNVLTYVYDSTGTHVTSVTDNLGYASSSTINMDFGLPATTTDENSQVVTYKYDAFGRTTDVWGPTDPTTGTATVHVDYSQGNSGEIPAWALTKNKDVQSSTGDTIDLVTLVDGLGRIVQTKKEAEISNNGSGGTQQVMLVSGPVLYDARARPITSNDPTAFTFNASRETAFEAVSPANTVTYAYDGIGRLTLKTYPDGTTEQHFYALTQPGGSYYPSSTLVGNRPMEVHGAADGIGAWTFFYDDALERRAGVTETASFGGVPTTTFNFYKYDAFSNVVSAVDTKQNTTSATYDSLNRMVTLTSPDAGMTELRYGTNGLLMQKQTGQLRTGSKWINYVYDTNSTRLKTVDYPTMPDVTFTYGTSTEKGNSAGNVAGRIKSVTMEGGTEQRTYDAFGNVIQTVTMLKQFNTGLASPTVTMKYSYDWMGRMQSMTFPKIVSNWVVPTGDGEMVSYVYDKGGSLKSITGKATPTSTPETYLSARTYDSLGHLAVDVAGNGVVTTRSYAPDRHWLTGIATATSSTAAPFQSTTFGYRAGDGMITSVTSTAAALAPNTQAVGTGTTTTTYGYDGIKELVSSTSTYRGHATTGYQTQSTFVYDSIGNLVTKTQTDTKQTFANASSTTPGSTTPMAGTTYGLGFTYAGTKPHATSKITETTSTSSTVTHNVTYDGSGNNTGETAGSTTRALIWDEADRLKEVDIGGTAKSKFMYNADGERTQRQDAANATNFYFNQFLVIHGNQYVTKHIFGGTERLVSKTEATSLTTPLRHFYHGDQLGSTSYITDAQKNLVQHERYFPFGERWADPSAEERSPTNAVNGAGGTLYPRNWLFTSKELDTDTGYYYYGARYYDARNARWLSPDPILASYMRGEVNSGVMRPRNLGLYSYSWNNPVVLRDPDGRAVGEDTAIGCLFGPAGCALGFAADLVTAALIGGTAAVVVANIQTAAPPPPTIASVPPALPAPGVPPSESNAPVGPMSTAGPPMSQGSGPQSETYTSEVPPTPPSVARGGESAAAATGREVHKQFADKVKARPGWQSEPTITHPVTGKKLRPDALTPAGNPVELKPNTPSGRAAGKRQIEKYKQATGKPGKVIYYGPRR